ncbi:MULTISPECIES: MgtC/SapB family protein [unclassified Streptomyces]|uniref:MgtC/SapB family protein n=1 Tax=unclassified Streptomyces TaxID=2593676 RepID=UPI002F918A99
MDTAGALSQLMGLANLVVGAVLSLIIGLERQYHSKPAGARTHALVGLGSSIFMVVSKYGFLDSPTGAVDGSRIAAQVASGVGFLGAGLIFVKRDTVRGLTTAASIWVVAAVGLTAGAGLWIVGTGAVLIYLVLVATLTRISGVLPHSSNGFHSVVVEYEDEAGALRDILRAITTRGFTVLDFSVADADRAEDGEGKPLLKAALEVSSKHADLDDLTSGIRDHEAIRSVEVVESV